MSYILFVNDLNLEDIERIVLICCCIESTRNTLPTIVMFVNESHLL